MLSVIGVLLLACIALLVVVGFNLDRYQEDAAPQVGWTNTWTPLGEPVDICSTDSPPTPCLEGTP